MAVKSINNWNNNSVGADLVTFQTSTGGNFVVTSPGGNVRIGGPVTGGQVTTLGSASVGSNTALLANSGGIEITTVNAGPITINSATGTISVSNTADAATINLGTGLAQKIVTLGSLNTTSSTNIYSGATGTVIRSNAGPISVNSEIGTISVSNDAFPTTINIGTGAGVKTTTLGSGNTTSATNVYSGSGTLNIASNNGIVDIESGTGNLQISTGNTNTTLSIGTGAGVKVVHIGSTNSTSSFTAECGTGGVSVGESANSHQSVFGSTFGTSNTYLQSGSGSLIISSANGALTANSGTGTLGISTDATANTINLGTGSGVKTVTLGSTNTTSVTTLQAGSQGINITGFTQGALTTNSSGVISTIAGTTGTVFAGVTGTNPAFTATPSVTSITISNAPVATTDGTNKAYVDAIAAGLFFKNTCYAATTATLNATYLNGVSGVGATLTNAGSLAAFSVDGVSPAINSRILVKNQSSSFQNGIYTLTTVGSGAVAWILTRATDFDQPSEIAPGDLVPVEFGTVNATTYWVETATVTTIGTDPITFSQFFGGGISTVNTDSGSATAVSGAITIAGTNGVTTSGTGSTVTVNLANPVTVAHGGTGAVTLTGILTGNGTSAVTANTVTQYGTVIAGASNAVSSVAPSATSGVPYISQGASSNPVFGTAVVAGGGTGVTTMTTAYAPVCAGTTATGALQVASTGLSTSGFILTSTGSSSLPSFQAPATPSGVAPWSVITANQAFTKNNGFICNKAGLLTLTLPTTTAVGDIYEVTGINTALGWKIAQNANQIIHYGTSDTTTGVGGSLASVNIRDSIKLVTVVANLEFNVLSSVGNITVV